MYHQGITLTGKELPAQHPRRPPFQKHPRIWPLSNQCQQGRPTFFFNFNLIVRHWSRDLWRHCIIISRFTGHHLVQENSVRSQLPGLYGHKNCHGLSVHQNPKGKHASSPWSQREHRGHPGQRLQISVEEFLCVLWHQITKISCKEGNSLLITLLSAILPVSKGYCHFFNQSHIGRDIQSTCIQPRKNVGLHWFEQFRLS